MIDILFINSTEALALNKEVNGTMILGTKLLQAGFKTKILRFCQIESFNKDYSDFIRDMTNRILEMDPKCVSFYTLWPHYHIMLRIAREVKQRRPDIVTVLGGPQATATANATLTAMDYVDYICTREGEHTVVPFFETVLGIGQGDISSIPGLFYRKNGVVTHNDLNVPLTDLNTLPVWDERLYAEDYAEQESVLESKEHFMPIDVGRGCPFGCTFCSTSRFLHRTYRLKSPEKILEEMRYYNQKYGVKYFMFSHDAFTVNAKLVEKVCDGLIESGLNVKWKCTTRINCITEALILKMKQAGMMSIEMGIETGSERMQKLTKKNLDLSKVKPMVKFCKDNGVEVSLFFMHGFPEETESDLNDTMELAFSLLDMGIRYASMSFCMFNPTTEITEKYFDQLVYDPRIKIQSRDIWGYQEELPVIRENKAIFPFFFHLDTPLRNEFQYLGALVFMYRRFPVALRYLRSVYHGDHLQFYRDFYYKNLPIFQKDIAYLIKMIKERPLEILDNMLRDLDVPNARQLRALCEYGCDLCSVTNSEEDISVRKTYDFSLFDLKMKLPLEAFSEERSEILLQKINGKKSVKLLGMR